MILHGAFRPPLLAQFSSVVSCACFSRSRIACAAMQALFNARLLVCVPQYSIAASSTVCQISISALLIGKTLPGIADALQIFLKPRRLIFTQIGTMLHVP